MQKKLRFLSLLLAALLLLPLLPLPVMAASPTAEEALLVYRAAEDAEHPASAAVQTVDGQRCLFLPASADLHALTLDFPAARCKISAGSRSLTVEPGKTFDFLALFPTRPADGRYRISVTMDGATASVCVMQSANLRSLYITSADPAKDHAYVDAAKSNKAKDNPMVLLDSDGRLIYQGAMKEIKGRGNSTWGYAKKPYQFKLKENADLLEQGGNEAAKTWILLANYADGSLMRNRMTNDLAGVLDIEYANHSDFVDLYYDGAYCGTYLLSEKVEIGDGRIEIRDLEKVIEEVNGEEVDFDALPTVPAANVHGGRMQVVDGVALPEDYTGGYLLEMDYESRAKEEKSWFCSTRGQYVVCKSPEYLPAEAMNEVSGLYQAFEDAVYNGGTHPVTGRDYTDYIDLPSLAKMYLLLAISQNGDAFRSSTYFYIPDHQQKLYGGPVWDFDTAYGLYTVNQVEGFVPARTGLVQMLLRIESFREAVNAQWEILQPVLEETVLDASPSAETDGVRSIASYGRMLEASRNMDALLWNHTEAYSTHIDALYAFLQQSCIWAETALTDPETDWQLGFVDVDPDAWYASDVAYVTGAGYFSGFSDVLFQPDQQMTRAMLVTVLHRMAGRPEASGSCTFTDAAPDTWYSDAVVWAQQAGIARGIGNGRFGTEDFVTRQELVVFLHRFANYMGISPVSADIPDTFRDLPAVSSWAKEALGWAIDQKIPNGASENGQPLLLPGNTATRAETAAILHRYDLAIAR